MKAKKHLGQHFLTSKAALRDMIEAADVTANDTVLEIGPGKGVLTRALLTTGASAVAVETDPDMIAVLEDAFAQEIAQQQLTLIHGDVLNVPIATLVSGDYKLIANIPYYITGEIIRRFLTSSHQPTSMTLLIQKEVAERIARSNKETVLSLSVKAYGVPRYVSTVAARFFNPPPKVDSAILHIDHISRHNFVDISDDRFFKIVKAGFSSKRKQLINNLSPFGNKDSLLRALAQLGLPSTVRAEDVSLDDWIQLTKTLT